MSGKENESSRLHGSRARRRLSHVLLAALLAALTALLVAAPVLADGWPSDQPRAQVQP